MARKSGFCPTCGASKCHQKWHPRAMIDYSHDLVAGEDGWPTEGVGVALGLLDVVTAAAPRAPRTVPDAVRALADLVDVPRCRLVDAWDATRGRHYVDCTVCRFGSRAEGLPDGHPMATLSRELWRTGAAEACQRCPVCGAEVERD